MAREPTIKQKEAIKGVLIDKKSFRRAMLDAGYSKTVADNPITLKESEAFQTALNTLGLSDDDVIRRHNELMRSENEQIAMKAVDTAYKVKGKYDTNRTRNSFNAPVMIQINPPTTKDTARNKDI